MILPFLPDKKKSSADNSMPLSQHFKSVFAGIPRLSNPNKG